MGANLLHEIGAASLSGRFGNEAATEAARRAEISQTQGDLPGILALYSRDTKPRAVPLDTRSDEEILKDPFCQEGYDTKCQCIPNSAPDTEAAKH